MSSRKDVVNVSPTDTAKMVRKVLKVSFPTVKFSVKTSKYSGGSSIRVSWVNGPTTSQVKEVAGRYKGASFDGMIDLKSYHDTIIDGVAYSFGNDYINFSRDITQDMKDKIVNIAVVNGFPGMTEETTYDSIWSMPFDQQQVIRDLMHSADFLEMKTRYERGQWTYNIETGEQILTEQEIQWQMELAEKAALEAGGHTVEADTVEADTVEADTVEADTVEADTYEERDHVMLLELWAEIESGQRLNDDDDADDASETEQAEPEGSISSLGNSPADLENKPVKSPLISANEAVAVEAYGEAATVTFSFSGDCLI